MILILGSDTFEQGTDPVIDWLLSLKADFLKITLDDFFKNFNHLNIDIDQKKIYYKNDCLNDRVNVVWYRHFAQKKHFVSKNEHPFSHQINDELNSEIETFNEYFFECLKDKQWVSPFSSTQVNKLSMLNSAASIGLQTPRSSILNTQQAVTTFLEEGNGKSIIKQFSDHSRNYYSFNDKTYVSLVKGITQKDISNLPLNFFPTLFQERIDTDFEIRAFYIDGQFFATAILCEAGYEVDDRKKFVTQNNIHHLSYELPVEITEKLTRLMKTTGLYMGGIDLVKDKQGSYYFLEVNPIGQYLYESNKCNYPIPKVIAEYLIKSDTTLSYGTDQRHCF